jgi:hypothetical protein
MKVGLDDVGQHQIEQVVPREIIDALDAEFFDPSAKRVICVGEYINIGVTLEGRRVGQPFSRTAAESHGQKLVDLIHQRVMVPPGPVPLEDGELGVVAPSGLAVAERPADLVDGAAACRQQPFHGELGRGLKVEVATAVCALSAVATHQGLEVEVGDRGRGEERGLDFQHLASGEEGADPGEGLGAEVEGFGRSGGAPGVDSAAHFFRALFGIGDPASPCWATP